MVNFFLKFVDFLVFECKLQFIFLIELSEFDVFKLHCDEFLFEDLHRLFFEFYVFLKLIYFFCHFLEICLFYGALGVPSSGFVFGFFQFSGKFKKFFVASLKSFLRIGELLCVFFGSNVTLNYLDR